MAAVVEEWGAHPTVGTSVNTSPLTLDALVRREALENGIERPKGYNVSFHYNSEVEQHHFGPRHPMKPWRLHLTKQLILSYGLHYAMDLYQTREATMEELAEFHTDDYLDFLSQVTPDNMAAFESGPVDLLKKYSFGDDCPVFDGLYRYCSLYTGASLSAARNLTSNQSSIAINWSGGLHHAKKSEASGFCYVNDIVLAILELLRVHPRVLYIDLDVHHGDGVEAAFASTDRVMTLSFHKYDPAEFFPGTGGINETGPPDPSNPGAHHSLNVPLKDGIDDEQYTNLFRAITTDVVTHFRPSAIVLQCGADSLGGDRLGKFNLNIRAHGACLAFVKSLHVPLCVLGGGGYTARNVARLWTHETSLCTGSTLRDALPAHVPYGRAFAGPEYGDARLYPALHNIENKHHKNEHDQPYLDMLVRRIHEQLRYLKGAPSVQMRRMPDDLWRLREEMDAEMREDEDDAAGAGGGEAVMSSARSGGVGTGNGNAAGRGHHARADRGGGGGGGKAARGERRRKDKERNIGARGEMA